MDALILTLQTELLAAVNATVAAQARLVQANQAQNAKLDELIQKLNESFRITT